MPHLTVEYTNNLAPVDTALLLGRLNRVLVASGQFQGPDIKSRALSLDAYRVGDEDGSHGFVHLTLSLLSGRTPEVKKKLADQLLAELQQIRTELGWHADQTQLTVDIRDLEREFYAKG